MESEPDTEKDQVDAILTDIEKLRTARMNGQYATDNPSLDGIENFSQENQRRIAEAYIRLDPTFFAMHSGNFNKIDQKEILLFLIENCGGMLHVAGQYLSMFNRLTPDDQREIAMTMINKGPDYAREVALSIAKFDPSFRKEIEIALIHNGCATLIHGFWSRKLWGYGSMDKETLTKLFRELKNVDPSTYRKIQGDFRCGWYPKHLTKEDVEELINL